MSCKGMRRLNANNFDSTTEKMGLTKITLLVEACGLEMIGLSTVRMSDGMVVSIHSWLRLIFCGNPDIVPTPVFKLVAQMKDKFNFRYTYLDSLRLINEVQNGEEVTLEWCLSNDHYVGVGDTPGMAFLSLYVNNIITSLEKET